MFSFITPQKLVFLGHEWEFIIAKSNSHSLINTWIDLSAALEFSHDSLFFESLSLLGSQHTTKFCFFPSFPNLLHLASGIMLGFPKALFSALFPVYSPLVIFAHYLMALNTAQTGFMKQLSQDAGKQTAAGNRNQNSPWAFLRHLLAMGSQRERVPGEVL